jgi:hypothetical protein
MGNSSAKIILGGTGGTWNSANDAYLWINMDINCTDLTVSGNVYFAYKTLTYVAGTITTTDSTLNLGGNVNTLSGMGGVTWANIAPRSAMTITLDDELICSGIFTIQNGATTTMSGAYDLSCGTFYMGSGSSSTTFKMVSGTTLNVSTAILATGYLSDTTTVTLRAIEAATASSPFYLHYEGTAANCRIMMVRLRDIDASSSDIHIAHFSGGTMVNSETTRCTNITNVTTTLPAVTDVREGTAVGGGTGTLIIPVVADVKAGVEYDIAPNAKVGEYVGGGSATDIFGWIG